MGDEIIIRASLSLTYFCSQLSYGLCTKTILDLECLSSFAMQNFFITIISWILLFFLNKIYSSPSLLPISYTKRLVSAILQFLRLMIAAYGNNLSQTTTYLSYIIAIPVGVVLNIVKTKRLPPQRALVAATIFVIGASLIFSSSRVTSLNELVVSFLIAIVQVFYAFSMEMILASGVSPIPYMYSTSGFRMLISGIAAGMMTVSGSNDALDTTITGWSIGLFVAAAAADLAKFASMTSFISHFSALSFLITEEYCQIMHVFAGYTFYPTRFTTHTASVISFCGFLLSLPAHLFFMTVKSTDDIGRSDVEPFRVAEDGIDAVGQYEEYSSSDD